MMARVTGQRAPRFVGECAAAFYALGVQVVDTVAETDGVLLAITLVLTEELAAADCVGLSENVVDRDVLILADTELVTVVAAVTLACKRE